MAETKNVAFQVYSNIINKTVISDPNKINQIIQNILSNALKFCKKLIILKITQEKENFPITFEVNIIFYTNNFNILYKLRI